MIILLNQEIFLQIYAKKKKVDEVYNDLLIDTGVTLR